MSDIPFNPAADQLPYTDFTAAALEGAQAGQAQRGISALQGIDLNDPNSVNRAMTGLVRAGAGQMGSAITQLQLDRMAVDMAPKVLAHLLTLGNRGAPKAATAATPAQAPSTPPGTAAPVSASPTGTEGPSQPASPDPHAVAAVNTQMANDARAFSQAPPDQQPAMAASLKQKYLGMGFPEASIDAALAHAAVPGGADELATHYDAHAQALTGGQYDPAALQPPGKTYDWTKDLLDDPLMIGGLDFLKKHGIDYTATTEAAQRIAAPEIAKEAEQAHAAAITQQTHLGALSTLPAEKGIAADLTPPVAGATPTYDVSGRHIGWQMPSGALQSIAQAAEATTSGQKSGAAPYDHFPLPIEGKPGSMVEARMVPGPNGPVPAPLVGGALPAGAGTSAGVASTTGAQGQSTALNAESDAASDRLKQFPAAIARGEAFLGVANSLDSDVPGAYTKALQSVAQYVPTDKAQKYATNVGSLTQDLSSSFKDSLNGLPLPRISSEAKAVTGAVPPTTAPHDQLKYYAAGILANTQYQQAHDLFIQQWTSNLDNPRDRSQAEAAWSQKANGGALYYEMPAWKGVTLGGKPAIDEFQGPNGHTYIAIQPGILSKPPIVKVR